MASVQMSQTLREQILDLYRTKVDKTLRDEYNVTESVQFIIDSFVSDDSDFQKLIDLDTQVRPIYEKLKQRYGSIRTGYYDNNFKSTVLESNSEIGFVCNPNRPISENFSYIADWQYPFQSTDYDGNSKTTCSDNYVEGDTAVKITDLEPFYAPLSTSVEYTSWRATGYSPHANCAILITDPGLCNALSPIGTIEKEVDEAVAEFGTWLQDITTLTKFLNEVPSGTDFVPQEYLDRLNAKPVKKAKTAPLPTNAMPDALKKSINEVILETKLMGE